MQKNVRDNTMLARYLKVIIYTSFVVVLFSYIFVHSLTYKANQEIEITSSMVYSIHQLKDLHTICILDYQYNTADKNLLKECKKVENEISTTLKNYYSQTPYLNFYKEYLQ